MLLDAFVCPCLPGSAWSPLESSRRVQLDARALHLCLARACSEQDPAPTWLSAGLLSLQGHGDGCACERTCAPKHSTRVSISRTAASRKNQQGRCATRQQQPIARSPRVLLRSDCCFFGSFCIVPLLTLSAEGAPPQQCTALHAWWLMLSPPWCVCGQPSLSSHGIPALATTATCFWTTRVRIPLCHVPRRTPSPPGTGEGCPCLWARKSSSEQVCVIRHWKLLFE